MAATSDQFEKLKAILAAPLYQLNIEQINLTLTQLKNKRKELDLKYKELVTKKQLGIDEYLKSSLDSSTEQFISNLFQIEIELADINDQIFKCVEVNASAIVEYQKIMKYSGHDLVLEQITEYNRRGLLFVQEMSNFNSSDIPNIFRELFDNMRREIYRNFTHNWGQPTRTLNGIENNYCSCHGCGRCGNHHEPVKNYIYKHIIVNSFYSHNGEPSDICIGMQIEKTPAVRKINLARYEYYGDFYDWD